MNSTSNPLPATPAAKIAILLKDDVFEEQYPMYREQFKRNFGREPKASELQFVKSSGSRSLIQLKPLLKRGYHVICYVDGEEGGSGERGWTQIQHYLKYYFDKIINLCRTYIEALHF